MWECYNEKQELQRAFLIKKLPKEIIQTIVFTCPKCEEPLIFKAQNSIKQRSHFAHKKDTTCKGYFPEGESEQHYNLKMQLLDTITNDTLTFKIGNLFFETRTNEFEIDLVDIETKAIKTRIGDIILKLKTPNQVLGLGIIIEVMISETEESITEKIKDYSLAGYSVCKTTNGLDLEITETFPELNVILFEEYKKEIELYSEKIKLLNSDFYIKANKNGWACTNCDHAGVDNRDGRILICWKHKEETVHGKMMPEKKTNFTLCEDYVLRSKLKEEIILEEPIPHYKCPRGELE